MNNAQTFTTSDLNVRNAAQRRALLDRIDASTDRDETRRQIAALKPASRRGTGAFATQQNCRNYLLSYIDGEAARY